MAKAREHSKPGWVVDADRHVRRRGTPFARARFISIAGSARDPFAGKLQVQSVDFDVAAYRFVEL